MEKTTSYFDGGLAELIGTQIICALVCTVSLGFAAPWAYCKMYKWQMSHTVINGQRLDFNGTASDLFGKWIKWALLTIVTLGIYSFWLTINLKQWQAAHTTFAE